MTDIVVGSGPSGAITAARLIERGRRVLMIDAGERLGQEAEALRAALDRDHRHWRDRDVARLKEARAAVETDGMAPYGSDFHMRDSAGALGPYPEWFGLRPSFAYGGLSNGWGASFAPYLASDIADWPIPADSLSPWYAYVARIAPVAGVADGLAEMFTLAPARFSHALAASSQARYLLERADRRRAALTAMGVHIGRARNAVAGGCVSCGLCLHGCPYRLIFNASSIVESLRTHAGFAYVAGRRAISFAETNDRVALTIEREGARETIEGERLYLAAGVLPTARIVLASRGPAELTLKDSSHFFQPFLHLSGPAADPALESRHALAQAFVEIVPPGGSGRSAHVQIYTYNDLFRLDLEKKYGRLPLSRPILDAVARRLIVAQGFLHSDFSPTIRIGMHGDSMRYSLDENPKGEVARKAVRATLARALGGLGLYAVGPAARAGKPGSSFHAGGTLPMVNEPGPFETDIWGRLGGAGRTHIVDASVLPSVPATTITYSVMANAARIASQEF